MFSFADFVKATTTTEGTGDITLASSPTGFRSFAEGFSDQSVMDVLVVDNPSAPSQWEVFEATYNDLATDTLTRGTLRSSSTGSRINFSAGTKTVVPAPSALFYDLIAQAINANIDATGSSGAYAVTTPAGLAPTRGYRITFKANHDNPAGGCTLNPDGHGNTAIKLADGTDPYAGAIKNGGIYTVEGDGTNFQLLNPFIPQASGKNDFLNPAFQFFRQQNNTVGSNSGYYGPDCWRFRGTAGTGGSITLGQQASSTYIKMLSIVRSSVTGDQFLNARVPNLRKYSGQTITISFYVSHDTAEATNVTIAGNYGTGGTPSSGENYFAGQPLGSIQTGRHSLTRTIPSISGKTFGTDDNDYLDIFINMTGTDDKTLRFAWMKLEIGDGPTPFVWPDEGQELARCSFYGRPVPDFMHGFANGATSARAVLTFDKMRVAPTLRNAGTYSFDGSSATPTASTGTDYAVILLSGSGFTAGDSDFMQYSSGSRAWLGAEL